MESDTKMTLVDCHNLPDGMAVTVYRNERTGSAHVGLFDVDSGKWVPGSVRVFPAITLLASREALNGYVDRLISGANSGTYEIV